MTQKGKFAGKTTTTVSKSKEDLERTLRRYGVEHFAYASQPGALTIAFRHEGDMFRIVVPMPDPQAQEFTLTAQGRARTASAARELYEQAERSRWRALLLKVKADLEFATLTAQPLRTTFVAHLVLVNGETVTQRIETDRGAPPALTWMN